MFFTEVSPRLDRTNSDSRHAYQLDAPQLKGGQLTIKCNKFKPIYVKNFDKIPQSVYVQKGEAYRKGSNRRFQKVFFQFLFVIKTHNPTIHKFILCTYFRVTIDVYSVQVVFHRINNDENVPKFCVDNSTSEISGMFRPDDVDFVVTEVPQLK